MSSDLQALKTEIEKLNEIEENTQYAVQAAWCKEQKAKLAPQLLALAEALQARLKAAETALEFYKDSWHYDMIGTGEQGSTMSLWEPDRELLDDGGNKATEALADIRREG